MIGSAEYLKPWYC